jgi:hypothetical protein
MHGLKRIWNRSAKIVFFFFPSTLLLPPTLQDATSIVSTVGCIFDQSSFSFFTRIRLLLA